MRGSFLLNAHLRRLSFNGLWIETGWVEHRQSKRGEVRGWRIPKLIARHHQILRRLEACMESRLRLVLIRVCKLAVPKRVVCSATHINVRAAKRPHQQRFKQGVPLGRASALRFERGLVWDQPQNRVSRRDSVGVSRRTAFRLATGCATGFFCVQRFWRRASRRASMPCSGPGSGGLNKRFWRRCRQRLCCSRQTSTTRVFRPPEDAAASRRWYWPNPN